MGATTGISWCDSTWNPWWGCTKVSQGCAHCYAETLAKRWDFDVWGAGGRRFFGDKHWNEPRKWDREASKAGIRKRVFCASMADVFEDRRDLDGQRLRLWELIDSTRNLDWLLLTKRPEKIAEMVPRAWLASPLPNVWLGASVEDRQTADARIQELLKVPAWIRFVSYEPALGPVDFRLRLGGRRCNRCQKPMWGLDPSCGACKCGGLIEQGPRIDWLIVGGESGPGARPFDVRWALDTIQQCRDAGVACFVKQVGAQPIRPVGNACMHWIAPLKDPKGGDPAEWPVDLRVRQFPERAR